MNTPLSQPALPPKRWYREPFVWLVVGGPLVVVVASFVTLWVAIRNPDPVISKPAPIKLDQSQLQQLPGQEQATAAQLSLMPAGQARNHVMTPQLPKEQ